VKVFVELTRFAATATARELRDRVRELEDAGASGISFWDHIFMTRDGVPRSEKVEHACDPLTTLAAIAGITDGLDLQTVVVNSDWTEPGLLLRQFAQLGVLLGDAGRVTAGLGAGWSKEEFDAMGVRMLPFAERMARFEETLQIARQMIDTGWADFSGQYRKAVSLPLSPETRGKLRILIGGGSDRAMALAGKYADVLDILGDPRFGRLVGRSMAEKHHIDTQRRALTTSAGLGERYALVREAAVAAGRPADAVRTSVQVWFTVFGGKSEVAEREARICREWGHIEPQSLADNPYLLMGSPAQMAEALLERKEKFGLDQIALRESDAGGETDQSRFCREVASLVR
jgi:alkanesulfonate monooxygenase SsuD/methylene tetrahydromethanopterin reductase-like flavin-dependent oxidoreductase (luciferase family)